MTITITTTINVLGVEQTIERKYTGDYDDLLNKDWNELVEEMLDTVTQ